MARLNDIDQKEMPNPPTREALAVYNGKRPVVLEEIIAEVPAARSKKSGSSNWSIASPARRMSRSRAIGTSTRLKSIKDSLAKGPNPALAAYVAFRYLQTENNIALATNTGPVEPVQEKWRKGLEEFVEAVPHFGRDARRRSFAWRWPGNTPRTARRRPRSGTASSPSTTPDTRRRRRAAGASSGWRASASRSMSSGTNLATGQPFSAASLKGKPSWSYYWASWSQSLPDDVKKLNSLVKELRREGAGGRDRVPRSRSPRSQRRPSTAQKIPGTHLFAPGGLDGSPLAANYGILVVPHLFVADKDGKIVNRSAQAATVEDDVKKLLP